MTLIERNIEAIKLALLSHTPIVWLVCNEKEVANDIAVGFCNEHLGVIYEGIGQEFLLKELPSSEKFGTEPKICYGWFNCNEQTEFNLKENDEKLYTYLEKFLSCYLKLETETTYRTVIGEFKKQGLKITCIQNSIIIIASPNLPREGWFTRYIEVIHVGTIDDVEIKSVIDNFKKESRIEILDELYSQLVVNFRGISKREIEQVLERCLVQEYFDTQDEDKILNEVRYLKKRMLEGFPGLKWIDYDKKGLKAAGLDGITNWLNERKHLFKDPLQSIREGHDIPKGILVTGIPGTGKSLMAKQAAIDLDLPLIAMDLGDLQEGLIGKSEEHMANALRMVDSMSPCVLWIDEIEKAFSGSNSSHSDGGVMRRMFGKFLTWMQEKKSYVFVFSTSNDISQLPPELFRSERFDAKFYSFMPTLEECAEIFRVNILKINESYRKVNEDKNLFDNEVENINFWKGLLDNFCTKNKVDLDESTYRWQGNQPQNKLFTGADISSIIKIIKFELLMNNEIPDGGYGTDTVKKIFKSVLKDFMPYGETNLIDIAKCFLSLSKNRFMSASKELSKCIIEKDGEDDNHDRQSSLICFSDLKNGVLCCKDEYKDNTNMSYNAVLHRTIVGAVNELLYKNNKENENQQ